MRFGRAGPLKDSEQSSRFRRTGAALLGLGHLRVVAMARVLSRTIAAAIG